MKNELELVVLQQVQRSDANCNCTDKFKSGPELVRLLQSVKNTLCWQLSCFFLFLFSQFVYLVSKSP